MYIMLNGKPFDILKINDISEVICLTSKIYHSLKNYVHEYDRMDYDWKMRCLKTVNELIRISPRREEIIKGLDEKKDFIIGYYFQISSKEIYYSCNGGISETERLTASRLYETEQQAVTSLEHLVFEINALEQSLLKIDI